ncbi:MAG TPA: hypothetical protein VG734_23135 [Lacunisphaera sp.]|nr:hypothetical protein [Lacunisphaera sp.]
MATRNEHLQRLWHQYERENGGVPASPREVVRWAMAKGLIAAPPVDVVGTLAEEMARALREEYRTDSQGRRYRVNHSVKISRDGVQTSLWAELEAAPHEHMVKAFAERRRQIVGDCLQLKVDVDVYNENHREPAKPPVQLVLDFEDDVAELQALGRGGRAA